MRRVMFALVAVIGCTPERQTWENTFDGAGEDFFALDDDFTCIGDERWSRFGDTRVTNALGHDTQPAIDDPAANAFPVGTILTQLIDEAMVKRGAGFSPDTDDWEFIQMNLGSGRTVITARGTTEMANPAGSCMSCHSAASAFDNVCSTNTACAPLPFFIDTDVAPADDPRCP